MSAPKKDKSGKWGFVVDVHPQPARRCTYCRHRVWLTDQPRGDACPKCGGPLGEIRDERRQLRRRGFATKREAQEALDRLNVAVADDVVVTPARITVGEYLARWLDADLTVKPSTAFSYRRNLEAHVIPRIGSIELRRLDGLTLNRLYATLSADGANRTTGGGLSARTVRYIHTILHRAFREAVEDSLIARNPADTARPPRSGGKAGLRAKLRYWTAEQLADFLSRSVAEKDRDAALWRLIASTGLRRGEALGLRWRDLDLDGNGAGQGPSIVVVQAVTAVNHEILVEDVKTDSGARRVDLDVATVAALRSHRATRLEEHLALGLGQPAPVDLVFAEPTGEPLHPEAVSKRFDRRVARYGLPHIGVHGLRHTWATLALEAGVHPRVVQERLGHSTVMVTLHIYSHVQQGQGADAAQRVADLIDGARNG